MPLSLLATKLFPPPVRAGQVPRERLLARLDALLQPGVRLALISAPAGFGKSSLLAEWIASRRRPAAWLSLDAGDHLPESFLAYLVAAVERACPGLAQETAAALSAQPPPAPETALAMLVNELAGADPHDPLVIALDDLQAAGATIARDCLAFLVEHLPPGLRLAIATRADPALPLARLRARGQMVELRAADLRFTAAEAEDFLRRSSSSQAGETSLREAAALLAERTEGWAAGLQMAAVALQAAPGADPVQFARAFSGSHRFMLDYLAEEVLARLPESTVSFLLNSAPLERFCAALCAAAIEGGLTEAACQEQLDALDRANLFLIPLDEERRWFRYHHLFADLLRARLKQLQPDAARGIHRRASLWFERAGLAGDAIRHILAAAAESPQPEAEYERAALLVEKHTVDLLLRGELHGLQQWIALLPPTLVEQRPWLNMQRVWLLTFAGQMAEIEPALRQVEASTPGTQAADPAAAEDLRALAGHCAAVRCYCAVFSPNPAAVHEHIRVVEENLPAGSWARGVANWARGYILRSQGRLAEAEEIFTRQLQTCHARADAWGAAMACTDLGICLRLQGHLRDALRVYREGLAFVEAKGARTLGYTGRLLTAMAGALYDQNALDQAALLLEEAAALNQRWRNPNHLVFCYNYLARLRTAQGEFEQAEALLDQSAQVLRELPVVASLVQALESARINLAIAAGRIPPAGGPLEATIQTALAEAQGERDFHEPREGRDLLAARVFIAQRRPEEALRLLQGVEQAARDGGRGAVLIETLTLQALARCLEPGPGPAQQALAALEEALALAAPEGIRRPILDAGPLAPGALRGLLEALRGAPAVQTFAGELLNALPAIPAQAAAGHGSEAQPAANAALIEPLSDREREVLGLLAEGLTNVQIAARLVISPGTVKAHTANIFRKLDAANRTQAVAIARQAGLI